MSDKQREKHKDEGSNNTKRKQNKKKIQTGKK